VDKSEYSSLAEFSSQNQPFAERYVEAIFADDDKPATAKFADAFSISNYIPTFIDAQHWAADILEKSEFEQEDKYHDFTLMEDILFRFKFPCDAGDLSLEEAKSKATAHAEEFFKNSVNRLMFDEPPHRREWHAAHIYRFGEEIISSVDEYLKERKEIEILAGNVDDFYVSTIENERKAERRSPIITILDWGVKVGFLYRDAWWKFNHEEAAVKYYEHVENRKKGASKGARATSQKYKELKNDCLSYVSRAYKEKGAAFLGAKLKIKAQTIMELALEERPNDFIDRKSVV